MERLIMLGTGNAMVTKYYNTCFALQDDDEYFLVDAGGGNGILRQLELAQIDARNIHHIFLTHEHTDHLLGIIWMIRKIGTLMRAGKYEGELRIYCHGDLIEPIRTIAGLTMQKKFTWLIDHRILLVPLYDGSRVRLLDYEITFFDIHSTKAKQYGFTTTLRNGEKLTCCGDEPFNQDCCKYVQGSQWLLHEAFCLYSQQEQYKPYEKHHSTVKDACELAEYLGIPHLILYHTEDDTAGMRKVLYSAEGKLYYHGELIVPEDLESILLSVDVETVETEETDDEFDDEVGNEMSEDVSIFDNVGDGTGKAEINDTEKADADTEPDAAEAEQTDH